MAEAIHINHNPMHGLKREMKEHNLHDGELTKALIESNAQTQEKLSSVLEHMDEFVSMLKEASTEEEPNEIIKKEETTLKQLSDKLEKISQQNLILISAVNELIKLLKRGVKEEIKEQPVSTPLAPPPMPQAQPNWPAYSGPRRL